jgi:hypothetical protein
MGYTALKWRRAEVTRPFPRDKRADSADSA